MTTAASSQRSAAAAPPDMSTGIRAGLLAYTVWGLLTVYWKQLAAFDAIELIGWRILAAAAVMTIIVSARRSWPAVITALRQRSTLVRITAASLLLSCNWGAYVYAVVNDRVLETALGYFIAPLGTMAMGVFVLGERPSPSQRAAFVLALAAVAVMTISYGRVPVAALIISVTWSTYGLFKRHIPLTSVDGFAAESFVLVVPGGIAVAAFAGSAASIPAAASGGELVLVSLAGVATAGPLIMFSYAARRVPFVILGPLNYLVPIINFGLGWLIYDESLPWPRLVGFALVWIALIVVTTDQVRAAYRTRPSRY